MSDPTGAAEDLLGAANYRIAKLEAVMKVLWGFKEDIEFVAEREANDDAELAKAVKERIEAYGGE